MVAGPSAWLILDRFGEIGYLIWATGYPALLGMAAAMIGFFLFRRGDLP
jgi:ABC-2 type transport system permease protein